MALGVSNEVIGLRFKTRPVSEAAASTKQLGNRERLILTELDMQILRKVIICFELSIMMLLFLFHVKL